MRKTTRSTFTVDNTDTDFAPEVVYTSRDGTTTDGLNEATGVQLHIVALPATAVVQVDSLPPGGDPDTDGDWALAFTENAVGLTAYRALVGHKLRVRVQSGGTAGTADVAVAWTVEPV